MVAVPRQPSPWDGTEKCSGTVSGAWGSDGWSDPFFEGPEEAAIDLCRGTSDGEVCPKLHDCLIFALLNNSKIGVWGGTGEGDRRAIRKQWPLRRGKVPRPEWRVFEPGEPQSWFVDLEADDEPD